jgi:glycosyltransferase involved in cell wall biosynthesis
MSAAPVSVAFIVNSLRFGGAEKHTLQLFNGLASQGCQTALAYLKREEHLLPEADQTAGPVWCAEFGKGWDFAGLKRLADWLTNRKPDVLVCVNTYPLFYGHLARWLSGHRCRIVVIFHSTELPVREDRQMRWIYRPFFNRSDRIVYVSSYQRAYWEARGLCKELGVVIHNGIDPERFRDCFTTIDKTTLRERFGFKPGDFVVGICAALRPEKKHEDLIEAISRLKAEGLTARCLIIGDGSRRAAIESEIKRTGLESDVAIAGFQADVRPFIASCDCMAIVSQVETFSIAALESMALGKPMVMSAVGGAAEQVRNGVNGYLYPAGDVASLAAALRKLTAPRHCAELGEQARTIAARDFGIEGMLARYAQLFDEPAVSGQ